MLSRMLTVVAVLSLAATASPAFAQPILNRVEQFVRDQVDAVRDVAQPPANTATPPNVANEPGYLGLVADQSTKSALGRPRDGSPARRTRGAGWRAGRRSDPGGRRPPGSHDGRFRTGARRQDGRHAAGHHRRTQCRVATAAGRARSPHAAGSGHPGARDGRNARRRPERIRATGSALGNSHAAGHGRNSLSQQPAAIARGHGDRHHAGFAGRACWNSAGRRDHGGRTSSRSIRPRAWPRPSAQPAAKSS